MEEQTGAILIDDLLSDACPNCHNISDGGLRYRVITIDSMIQITVTCAKCGCNVVYTGTLTDTKFELDPRPIKAKKCSVGTKKYSFEVIECECGFHIGLDATYLDQVADIDIKCPACGETISVRA